MSTHTTVNAQRAADKLRQFVGECSPQGYATIPVSVVYMAIRALEHRALIQALISAQREAHQEQTQIPDTEASQ